MDKINQQLLRIKEISSTHHKKLDFVYDRAIQSISEGPSNEMAFRALSCMLSAASKPLTIDELTEVVAIETDSRALNPDNVPSKEAPSDICAGLIYIEGN